MRDFLGSIDKALDLLEGLEKKILGQLEESRDLHRGNRARLELLERRLGDLERVVFPERRR